MYPRFYNTLKTQSFFLFGPRGTGKTTWLRSQFPQADYVDLLNAQTARLLLGDPTRLDGIVSKQPTWVIIDEVQKAPTLLDEVHRLIEEKKWKFILTGSSARKLKRGAANLLAGRAIQKFFYPLTIWELGSEFNLRRALTDGLLPQAWVGANPKEYLSSYVYTYLKEEVFAEGLSRNLESFSRFLEIISFSQAQLINMASIARDVGVDAKVISNYVEVLEDLLLCTRLQVFTKKAKRRMTSHPKFFLFDNGIYRTIRPKGPLDSDADLDGTGLETLFFHHHRTLGEFVSWDQQLFFWRSAQKQEVDFISYGPLGLFAFEIKRTSIVRDEDLNGLAAFQSDYPIAKCYLLYGGEKELKRNHIHILNFEDGLRRLPDLFGVKLPYESH